MDDCLAWLLSGPAWIQYRVRIDLLGQPESDPDMRLARAEMLTDPQILGLINNLTSWPGAAVSSHRSAGQPFHKLAFLADLGLRADDPGIAGLAELVMSYQSTQGPFSLCMNIPVHFGGSGADTFAWALCDAPVTVYALLKFGLRDEPRIRQALDFMVGLVHDNGWPCAVSPELGTFRGPGRRDDPCPYATLVMLKVLAAAPDGQTNEAARIGVETLLSLWESSRERHPYLFYMGNDFRKLKAPFIWYDILHVLDVLSQFHWARQDPRLHDMAGIVLAKAGVSGRFTPESIWTAWKDWDFGQKKQPSRGLTLFVRRALQRLALAY